MIDIDTIQDRQDQTNGKPWLYVSSIFARQCDKDREALLGLVTQLQDNLHSVATIYHKWFLGRITSESAMWEIQDILIANEQDHHDQTN